MPRNRRHRGPGKREGSKMGELSKTLTGIANHMEMLEAENAQLRRQLSSAFPVVKALFEAIQKINAAPLGVVGPCLPADVQGKAQVVDAAVRDVLKRKGNFGAKYTAVQVSEWYKGLCEGASIKEVARKFGVDPKTVETRIRKLGGLCDCGLVIGTEEEPTGKGHDGVCGYCRGEKVGE
jgi:hypothetical protein